MSEDLRAELEEIREAIKLGGLTGAEVCQLGARGAEIERMLGVEPPSAPETAQQEGIEFDALPTDRAALWALLGRCNAWLDEDGWSAAQRASMARQRDRVFYALGYR